MIGGMFLFYSCRSAVLLKSFPIAKNDELRGWTQFGGDPQRTSFRERSPQPPFENIWIYKASSAIGPTLLATDSLLFFTTLDGKYEVLNIGTGQRLVRNKCSDAYEATCALNKNKLILASRYGDETLALLDLKSGRYQWRINAGDIASEPLMTENAIYIAALYKHIDKYDFETGEKIWTFKTEGHHRSSPALYKDWLVTGCDNGAVYALSAKTGQLHWRFDARASLFATPVISQETVFIGSLDSSFYALDLHSGDVLWSFLAHGPIFQSAASNGETVVFGASNGILYCLEAKTGQKRWHYQTAGAISTAPLVSDQIVYFGSLDRRYYGLDLKNGELLWRFETKGRVRTTPIIWGNYFFGASEDRYVFAFIQRDTLASGIRQNK